jgi:hypothetical protein
MQTQIGIQQQRDYDNEFSFVNALRVSYRLLPWRVAGCR